MKKSVILRRVARAEFDEAGDWFEGQRPGKGTAFKDAVRKVFDRIAANPKLHAVVLRDIRKAVVPGFRYCVYYRERAPGVVVVLSVFHTSRNPAIWQGRS